MRFLLLDRVEEFVPSHSLRGRVVFPRTLVYSAGRPDQPGPSPSMLLETMAQAGGWLLKVSANFTVLAIMSVIKGFRIHKHPPPYGVLFLNVRTIAGTAMLRGVTGTLSDCHDELIASTEAILYVLTPIKNDDWGKRAWTALFGPRELKLIGEGNE